MFKVENNAITITRGDSGIAEITLTTDEGEEYIPQEGDSIRFALKSNRFTPRMTEFIDIESLIEKIILITDLNLHSISPLKALPNTFVCCLRIRLHTGIIAVISLVSGSQNKKKFKNELTSYNNKLCDNYFIFLIT